MIRTKIVCTVGPAVDNPKIMRALVESGMNVARTNFSHGSHEEHLERITLLRSVAKELGVTVPIMLDTKGPEIRLGTMSQDVTLQNYQQFTLTTSEIIGNEQRVSISYKSLVKDISVDDRIFIDDGLVCLRVTSVSDNDIHTIVENGGIIGSRKGVNVPNVKINLPSMTEQDKEDILFAVKHNLEFIAVSFIRDKEDMLLVKDFLKEHNGENIKLIAKIENREGVKNLDEIITVADGIMIARGDLGVEIPVEEVPIVQKSMIERCTNAGKHVITATQMLDSMIRNPRPTRAEVNDVANAIFDGTSAIMLSGETASGKYPIESVCMMKRIAKTTEEYIDYWKRFLFNSQNILYDSSITHAIGHATCTTAMDLNVSAIVAVTTSGDTANCISSLRPKCPIIAVTTNEYVYNQLHLNWGVYPMLTDVVESTDDLFKVAVDIARASGLVKSGDIIVVTSGVPLGTSGTTNMLKVEYV